LNSLQLEILIAPAAARLAVEWR